MRVRTDDEVYRVDAVWLGPPKATFPWRARYVAWGVGIVVFLVVLTIERQMGIGLRVLLDRVGPRRHDRAHPVHQPSGSATNGRSTAVMSMWVRELTAPRERTAAPAERPAPPGSGSARTGLARRLSKKQTTDGRAEQAQPTAGRQRHGRKKRGSRVFGRRRDRDRRSAQHIAQHAARGPARARQGSVLASAVVACPASSPMPSYTPSIAARSIDGHLLRTGHEVYAWYRLAPQRWSFRSRLAAPGPDRGDRRASTPSCRAAGCTCG